MPFPILGTPKPQFFDSSGAPLTSGTLTIVEPSTDVNKATYPTYDDAVALNREGARVPGNAVYVQRAVQAQNDLVQAWAQGGALSQ